MILYLVQLFFYALELIVLAGVILSWLPVIGRPPRWVYHPAVRLIEQLSFRITRPFRQFMDMIGLRTGQIDFSPVLALLALQLLGNLVLTLLANIGIR